MLQPSNDYIGVIVSAEMTESDKGAVGAIIVVRPDGLGETARWYGPFTETVISKGPNEGKIVGEMTAETIGKFGCSDFTKIASIVGQPCAFGIKHEPDKEDPNKMWAKVSFLRPPRVARPVTSSGLAGINRFKGAAIAAARSAPKPAPKAASLPRDNGGYDDSGYGGGAGTSVGGGGGDDDIPFISCAITESESWWRWQS